MQVEGEQHTFLAYVRVSHKLGTLDLHGFTELGNNSSAYYVREALGPRRI